MKKLNSAIILLLIVLAVSAAVVALSDEQPGCNVVNNTIQPENPEIMKEDSFISENEAFSIIKSRISCFNTSLNSGDSIDIKHAELIEDEDFGTIWQYSIKTKSKNHVLAAVNATTGKIDFFYTSSHKPADTEKTIGIDDAKQIALDYLSERNLNKNLQLKLAKLQSPLGDGLPMTYDIIYKRIIQGIPCLSDGYLITVNANNGDITGFRSMRSIHEQNITVSSIPTVSAGKATKILQDYMLDHYGSDINVTSTELMWMGAHHELLTNDDSQDVKLIWKIEFRDAYYESENVPFPADGWINAHSGDLIVVLYELG